MAIHARQVQSRLPVSAGVEDSSAVLPEHARDTRLAHERRSHQARHAVVPCAVACAVLEQHRHHVGVRSASSKHSVRERPHASLVLRIWVGAMTQQQAAYLCVAFQCSPRQRRSETMLLVDVLALAVLQQLLQLVHSARRTELEDGRRGARRILALDVRSRGAHHWV